MFGGEIKRQRTRYGENGERRGERGIYTKIKIYTEINASNVKNQLIL